MPSFVKEVQKRIANILPAEAEVTKVELEGPEIVVYTKNPSLFMSEEDWIKRLAGNLKKRVLIRADSSLLLPPEKALELIKKIVPESADVVDARFDPSFNTVTIHARKVGLVIGKHGRTLKEIFSKTGWAPRLLRVPTRESEIIRGIRLSLHKESDERKRFLTSLSKKIYRDSSKKTDWIKLSFLGGCREVGRSCTLVQTPESNVLIDCGLSVSATEYPYLTQLGFPLDELDAVIVTHAHLDHSGFVPYLYEYGYKGPVYSTAPTRDVSSLLQFDCIDVLKKEGKDPVFKEKHVRDTIQHTVVREYGEVTDISPDIRLTLHNAGHILGSASVHLHIGEGMHNLVHTGDMKSGYTKLFDPTDASYPRLETLIIESTYGGPRDMQPPRFMAEKQLLGIINQTVSKGGSVLIPVFAIGRAQEIMMVLEEYFRNKRLELPVFIDGMCLEASAIHTAYPEYLRRSLQKRILHNDNPFDSEIFINADKSNRQEAVESPSIILSTAGMMNGGPVLSYFKLMSEDPRNTLVFVGYQGLGTNGRKVQRGVNELVLPDDGKSKAYKVNLRVETVDGFSGHSDRNQLLDFVKRLRPRPERIITQHGEESKCMALSKAMSQIFRVESMAPRNMDSLRLS